MRKVASIYNTLLPEIGPLGLTGYQYSWVYQLAADKTINIIRHQNIVASITEKEIRLYQNPWHTQDGNMKTMPYKLMFNVKSGGKSGKKGQTYIIEYDGLSVEVKEGDFAIYTDEGGLQANNPHLEREIVPARRAEVLAYIRYKLGAVFAAAKLVGPVGTVKWGVNDPDVLKTLSQGGSAEDMNEITDSSFARIWAGNAGAHICKANPKNEINNFINRNKAAIYEAFGVYADMEFKPPPAA